VACVWQLQPLAERRRAQATPGQFTPAQARLLSGKSSARSLVSLRVAGGPRRSIELTMSMPGSEKRSAKSGCNRVSDRMDDEACYCAMIDWRTRRRSFSSSSSFQRQNAIR
jgi:hypothetical protein